MNKYLNNLKSFLSDQSPNFPFHDGNSILEVLCYDYCATNSADNAVIRYQFKALNDVLQKLTVPENDAVFTITCDLCTSHIKQAFLDGIRTGVLLYNELNDHSIL